MSYLNDPNTHRLATNCCLCGKALRDADSVEIGIGPVCRDRAGYSEGPSEHRAAVNKLIHSAGCAAEDGNVAVVLEVANDIYALGFTRVALTIRHRFIPLKVWRLSAAEVTRWNREERREEVVEGQTRRAVCVTTPYSQQANENRRNFIRGRQRPVKNGRDFHWEFDHNQQRNLLAWLSKNWGGQQGLSLPPDGEDGEASVFTIPTWSEFRERYVTVDGDWRHR